MRKFVTVTILIIAAALVYFLFHAQLFAAIKANPATASIFREITGQTLLGLFYISVFGSLFFIFFPAEVPFIYYCLLGHNPLIVAIIAVVGNLVGLAFNYTIGRLVGQGLLQRWLKQKYLTWLKWTDKWGAALIVFGNSVPFPIEPASLVIGGLKYPFGKFLKWSAVGRMLKYLLVWLVFVYASHVLLPLVTTYLPLNATII
ncbi:MAG: VTT domain-containing protein [Candidatus Aenigmatarchaeota archaeon]